MDRRTRSDPDWAGRCRLLQKRCKVTPAVVIGIDVLAEKLDLQIAARRQFADFAQDLLVRAIHLSTPGERDDAIGARLVAPFHDRDERLRPGGTCRRAGRKDDGVVIPGQTDGVALTAGLLDQLSEA